MPRAETEADRKNQTEIANYVVAANPARYDGYIWLSEFNYRLDGCLFKRNGYAIPKLFFEAKQRDYAFGFYKSGFLVSVGKLMAAQWLKQATGLRTAFFVRFTEGVVAGAMIDEHSEQFRVAGRTDRPDFPHDIEPCVTIPWDRFKIIGG